MAAYVKCQHLDTQGKSPLGRKTYQCRVEVPQPVLPVSVTKGPGFRWPPFIRSWVAKADCAECPLFEAEGKASV